jgi:hypothetical protein
MAACRINIDHRPNVDQIFGKLGNGILMGKDSFKEIAKGLFNL